MTYDRYNSYQIPSVLEPSSLFQQDRKRTDGLPLVPWIRTRLMCHMCVDTLSNNSISHGDEAAY